MNENQNGEQLETLTEGKGDALKQEEILTQNEEESGSLKKFKNFSDLEKAYINLEKEFTKKCQALKQLQQSDNDDLMVASQVNSSPQSTLDYEQKVNNFFEENPSAKPFAQEISNVLKSDKALADSPDSLNKAFEKVKAKNFKTKDEMLLDSDFIENYVLKDKNIKDKILSEYLNGILSSKATPVMSTSEGSNVMITPKRKPTSLKEAGDYLVSVINNK